MLRTEARALPRGIAPRIGSAEIGARRRSPWLGRGVLTAAAVVLMTISSAATVRLLQR